MIIAYLRERIPTFLIAIATTCCLNGLQQYILIVCFDYRVSSTTAKRGLSTGTVAGAAKGKAGISSVEYFVPVALLHAEK